MRYTKLIYAVCLPLSVVSSISCNERPKQEARRTTITLKPLTSSYTEVSTCQAVKLGELQLLQTNQELSIRVSKIDSGTRTCSLEIHAKNGVVKHGEMAEGEYASFADDLVGKRGLQLEKVGLDGVTFRINGSKTTEGP